jgi:hypothetical protein
VVALGSMLAPRRAIADAAPVRLALVHMPDTASCLDRASLIRDVVARLRRDPFGEEALRSIEVVLSREEGSWVARIYARETPASNPAVRSLTFSSAECDRIESSVALAVALAIDPDAPLAPVQASSSPPPSSPAPEARAPARPARADATAWDASERVGLAAIVTIGPLPSAAPGVALTVDTRRIGRFRATFGALRTTEVQTNDRRFGFSLTSFWGAACVGTANRYVSASACMGVQGGFVTGIVHVEADRSLMIANPGDYGWLTVVAPARLTLRIVDALSAEVTVEPYVAAVRWRFTLEHGGTNTSETVFEQSPVGLTGYAGLSARFW